MFLELEKLKGYATSERQGLAPLSLLADAAETIEKTQARVHVLEVMLSNIAEDLEDEMKSGGQNPLRYEPAEIRRLLKG